MSLTNSQQSFSNKSESRCKRQKPNDSPDQYDNQPSLNLSYPLRNQLISHLISISDNLLKRNVTDKEKQSLINSNDQLIKCLLSLQVFRNFNLNDGNSNDKDFNDNINGLDYNDNHLSGQKLDHQANVIDLSTNNKSLLNKSVNTITRSLNLKKEEDVALFVEMDDNQSTRKTSSSIVVNNLSCELTDDRSCDLGSSYSINEVSKNLGNNFENQIVNKNNSSNIENFSTSGQIIYKITDVNKFFEEKKTRFSPPLHLRSFTSSEVYCFELLVIPNSMKTSEKPKNFDLFVKCSNINDNWSCHADIELRLLNQLPKNKNKYFPFKFNFSSKNHNNGYGLPNFISYKELTNPKNGFYVNDMIILEAQIKLFKK